MLIQQLDYIKVELIIYLNLINAVLLLLVVPLLQAGNQKIVTE